MKSKSKPIKVITLITVALLFLILCVVAVLFLTSENLYFIAPSGATLGCFVLYGLSDEALTNIIVIAVFAFVLVFGLILGFIRTKKLKKKEEEENSLNDVADTTTENNTVSDTAQNEEETEDDKRPTPIYGTRYNNETDEVVLDDDDTNRDTVTESYIEPLSEEDRSNNDEVKVTVVPEKSDTTPTKKTETKKATTKKSEPKKTAAKPAAKKQPTENVRENIGKYVITNSPVKDMYRFLLKAANGQLLYESRDYTTPRGAKQGINTFRNAVKEGSFSIDTDKSGRFNFRLQKQNNIYEGETVTRAEIVENTIESVKHNANSEVITEEYIAPKH